MKMKGALPLYPASLLKKVDENFNRLRRVYGSCQQLASSLKLSLSAGYSLQYS